MAYEVITLNLIPSGDVPVIHAAQFDKERPLKFALKLGDDDFNPSGYDLELQIRKVDNNIVTAASSDVSSNIVTFLTTEQMTACSGTNLGEIQIAKDGLDIATLHFYLVVQRDVLSGGITSESEIHNLTSQIEDIAEEVISENCYTKTETDDLLSAKADTADLAPVATSGSYDDLTDKPDIPDVSDYYDKEEIDTLLDTKANVSDLPDMSDYYNKTETDTLLSAKANTTDLASVATSGSYNDLSDKPTIPTKTSDLLNDSNFISFIEVTGTLSAGNTSLTLSDASILTTSTIDIYCDAFGVQPINAVVTTGQIVLTFLSQVSALGVKVRIS